MKTICIALVLIFGLHSVSAAEDLVIGTIFELKGNSAPTAQEALNGALLAVEKINKSNSSRKIKLEVESTTTDPLEIIKAMDRLKMSPGISAATGIISGNAALTAAPSLQSAQLPFLCTGAQVDGLAESTGSNIFTLAVPDIRIGQLLAEYTTESLQVQNIVLIRSDLSDSTARQADSFARRFKRNGGKLMAEMHITEPDSDLSPIAQKINALKPQPQPSSQESFKEVGATDYVDSGAAIITEERNATSAGPEIEAVVILAPPKLCTALLDLFGSQSISYQIIGGTSFDTVKVQQEVKKWKGTIFYASQSSLSREDTLVESFLKAYADLFGVAPETGYSALGFDSIMLLAASAGSKGNTSENIRTSLPAINNFSGVSGKISFNGRAAYKPLFIIQAESGQISLAEEMD